MVTKFYHLVMSLHRRAVLRREWPLLVFAAGVIAYLGWLAVLGASLFA